MATTRQDSMTEQAAYQWAKDQQGYVGRYEEWLQMPADERDEYEQGAAGIPTA